MLALEKHPDRVRGVDALRSRIAQEYRNRALDRMRQNSRPDGPLQPAIGWPWRSACAIGRAKGVRRTTTSAAFREIFDMLRQRPRRAPSIETRAAELARALDDRDRTIDAMTRTRVWRMAQKWWVLKHAVSGFLGRR
jgi:hypothetical protein